MRELDVVDEAGGGDFIGVPNAPMPLPMPLVGAGVAGPPGAPGAPGTPVVGAPNDPCGAPVDSFCNAPKLPGGSGVACVPKLGAGGIAGVPDAANAPGVPVAAVPGGVPVALLMPAELLVG